MDNIKIIFGAPGCGKTTRLMMLLEELLKTHAPDKIAFVSFTRKGTYEGVQRAKEKFNFRDDDMPYFHTLHSIAFRDGGFHKTDVINKDHYKKFSHAMEMSFTGYYTADFRNGDDKYLFQTFLERDNPKAAEQFGYDLDTKKLDAVRHNYKRFKDFAHVVDFTDMIETFIAKGIALPVEVAIIDEAQDLTSLQWNMCNVAFKDCQEIYVAGDDEQAIYEWSGADVNYFLDLPGEREILNHSYRLPQRILDLSKRISAMIEKKVDKDFSPVTEQGSISIYNSLDEVEVNSTETWYFLSRNNYFLDAYREYLNKRAQVYHDKEYLSIDRREVEAIRLYEKGRKETLSPTEKVKLQQYIKDGANKSLPWYDALEIPPARTAYYRDLIKAKTDLVNVRHTVNTIHGVKGGEADNVVLMLDFTNSVAANFDHNPDSEWRCLYVACTRAKKNLHIIHSNSPQGYDSFMDF